MNDMEIAYYLREIISKLLDPTFDKGVTFDGSFWHEIAPLVEQDRISSKDVFSILRDIYSPERNKLLDFGCGSSNYRPSLEASGWDWTGVDYLDFVAPHAAERVAAQKKTDKVHFYDGKILPFTTSTFDLVFSFLVFEHIQHVDVTFSEICRVLKPGGRLVGMVAYLEPPHDFSTFNFTPIGIKVASERNGLILRGVYPAYDIFSFLFMRLAQAFNNPVWERLGNTFNDPENFFHHAISKAHVERSLSYQQVNMLKLQFSAFVTFDIERPACR